MTRCNRTFLIASFLLLAGCNRGFDYGPTGNITGLLTMDGKSLGKGYAVVFMEPIAGYLAYGLTNEQGEFEVDSWNKGDLPVGKYKVQIAPPTQELNTEGMTAEEAFDAAGKTKPRAKPNIPARYVSHTTSGLEFDVIKGKNEFKIELASK